MNRALTPRDTCEDGCVRDLATWAHAHAHCPLPQVGAWAAAHGRLEPYAWRHTRLFANLCNSGLNGAALAAAAEAVAASGAPAAVV